MNLVYDLYAASALQALIAKLPIQDREGEFSKPKSQDEINSIRKEIAISAHRYAVLMMELRNEYISILPNCIKQNIPDITAFKQRREDLGLSLRDAGNGSGVSFATISRIENGKEAEFRNVRDLDNFYSAQEYFQSQLGNTPPSPDTPSGTQH